MFIIRAVNTQRYVRFDMNPSVLVLNGAVLLIQCIVMYTELPYWIVIESVCFVIMVALNAKPIIRGIAMLLGGMKKMLGGRKNGGKNS